MPDLSTARTGSLRSEIQSVNVVLAAAAPATRFILRGTAAVAAAGAEFGVDIPTRPLTSATSGDRSALWLGPDEWLLLAPEADTASLTAALNAAVGSNGAVVDISHRQTALLVEGPKAATVLNAGVPLDLSLKAFPVGMASRTIFEKAEIVLWRTGETSFRVEVWRSFASYVLALLQAGDRDAP